MVCRRFTGGFLCQSHTGRHWDTACCISDRIIRSLPVQIVAFLVSSILLLVLTRPIAIKYFNQERKLTNAESLIGQKAVVIETVDTLHNVGRVEVNGQQWSAKTDEPHEVIEKDAVVSIEGIQGVKLIVRLKEA